VIHLLPAIQLLLDMVVEVVRGEEEEEEAAAAVVVVVVEL